MATEFLSVGQFKTLAKIVRESSGIELKLKKKTMVENRLNRRLKALGLVKYEEYLRLLENPDTAGDEIGHLFDAISTNETFFFRKKEHFTVLNEYVFPEFFEGRGMKSARCWSAGCAWGQEPYSIAMSFLDYSRAHPAARLRILATDISSEAVNAVRQGVYSDSRTRGLTPWHVNRYFTPEPEGLRISEEARRIVSARILNLRTGKFPEIKNIIYCRNVMIYFSEEFRAQLIERFNGCLAPGGYFFVGPAESYTELDRFFERVSFPGATVYRKPG